MLLVAKSLAAIGLGQFLPGLLAVKLLGVGACREERWLMAAVVGGPISAAVYLASLLSGLPSPVYWGFSALVAIAAIVVPDRAPARASLEWPRRSVWALAALLAGVLVPYFATTGSLDRLDPSGNLLLDRALQRDALFHVALVRALETSYPPRLLSVGGLPVGYHVGYHLELALWARRYGIEPMDGLVRVGQPWFIALFVLSAYALARRLSDREGVRLLAALLVLASGFGFAVFFRPSVDWWSLAFMDWATVSIFLANPLLPALPLFFIGLGLVSDYARSGARGALGASVLCLGSLFFVKVFLGAQALAGLGLSALFRPNRRDRRAVIAFGWLLLAASPLVLHTISAQSSSNTAIGIRPLEIVRYSMEKLSWTGAVDALAHAGGLVLGPREAPIAFVATLLWIAGFLGLRLLAVPGCARDLASSDLLLRTMGFCAAIGIPLALVFRVAPAEAEGLSRLEALNDVGWFATQSGILLWFGTARVLGRFRPRLALAAALGLGFPATVQHFLHASSLPPDRVGRLEVEAAGAARDASSPSSLWVEPLDRSHPSLIVYLAGRPVVYDPYVGYDYMFVGRDDIDYRRHAIAQYFSTSDAAYRAWFLDYFDVGFVWRPRTEDGSVEPDRDSWLAPIFGNDEVALYRVDRSALARGLGQRIESAGDIPLGGRGQPFFGAGFRRAGDGELVREWSPGRGMLYLPLETDRLVSLTLTLKTPHVEGELSVGESAILLDRDATPIRIELPPPSARGLQAVALEWRGAAPLEVIGLELGSQPLPVVP